MSRLAKIIGCVVFVAVGRWVETDGRDRRARTALLAVAMALLIVTTFFTMIGHWRAALAGEVRA